MSDDVVTTIFEWLRPYQREILRDESRYRCILKSRQIGISDLIALEMVLTASGLIGLLGGAVVPHNCTIVSKRDTDAKDVIEKCKAWIRRLQLVEAFGPYLETDAFAATQIKFRHSGYRIISETQNPEAARGKTGHLYLDEYAFYQFQREIFRAAAASTESRPDLRITLVSTPNGEGDHLHEVYTDTRTYPDWSRHRVDVYRARDEGMPVDIDAMRAKYTADTWGQEFECSFLAGEVRYFDAHLLAEAEDVRPETTHRVILGIDTASVVDNTAVLVWRIDARCAWMCDCYVLPRIPYQGTGSRLGQVDIVDALVRELRPELVMVDKTGDNANAWTRGGGLHALLEPRMRGVTRMHGVTISIAWKNLWVERMKTGLQTKTVLFDVQRRDLVYSTRWLSLPATDTTRIVGTGFEVSPFPILRGDFAKVHKKWTGGHKTTFDTTRDDMGHGDSFWAAVLGYSATGARTVSTDLDAQLRRVALEAGAPTSDYGEYI